MFACLVASLCRSPVLPPLIRAVICCFFFFTFLPSFPTPAQDVVIDRDGKELTLQEVFESLKMSAHELSVDTLDVHVGAPSRWLACMPPVSTLPFSFSLQVRC
mgnify:CR=1 FL=1